MRKSKRYPMRKWASPIELAMRNALVEHVANSELGVDLSDYSTSPIQGVFDSDYGDVLAAKWNVDPRYFKWGNGQQPWCLYSDVRAETYRLDFLLVGHGYGACTLINIECDGHEWHERNKQQASADRARDRELLRSEITTVRFTGSDIFNRANECAREVWDLALLIRENADMRRNIIFASGQQARGWLLISEASKAKAAAFVVGALGEVG